jgi:leucyl aminopeptidase
MLKFNRWFPLSFFLISPSAFSAEALRYVETAPGERSWMTEEAIEQLSHQKHQIGSCAGYFDLTDWPASVDLSNQTLHLTFNAPHPTQQALVTPLLTQMQVSRYQANLNKLGAFHNRFHSSKTGVSSAEWIKSQIQAIIKNRSDVRLEVISHDFTPQPSFIVTIPGEGPLANEIVVLGAHEDSINGTVDRNAREGARSPGVDDNGSGVASVLETLRVVIESGQKFPRTLQFMTFAAEEVGLKGSQAITQNYRNIGKNVVGMMNLDMTLYPGRGRQVGVVTSNTDPILSQFVKELIDTYIGLAYADRDCGYACSDHASFSRQGYPSVYPSQVSGERINPKWHKPDDLLIEGITDVNYGFSFAKLGAAFMVEMAHWKN